MLTYDAPTHTYYWQGVVVPSVSGIISGLRDFAGIPAEYLDNAAERGTDVHAACEFHDRGTLDESTITSEIRPYLDAWRSFRERENPQLLHIEEAFYQKVYGYAGRPDRVAMLRGKRATLEIKATAELHPSFGVQLVGYGKLVDSETRWTVHLKRDGKFALKCYEDRNDDLAFLSLHTLYHWRKRNGC